VGKRGGRTHLPSPGGEWDETESVCRVAGCGPGSGVRHFSFLAIRGAN
jgi:hypothetical protein